MFKNLTLLSVFALGACGPDLDALRQACVAHGRVQVRDPSGWSAFVQALRDEHRKYGDRSNEEQTHLEVAPVSGFRIENEYSRGKDLPKSSLTQNDVFIEREGTEIATLTNYTLRWNGFDSGQSADCVNTHPEVYGITLAEVERTR